MSDQAEDPNVKGGHAAAGCHDVSSSLTMFNMCYVRVLVVGGVLFMIVFYTVLRYIHKNVSSCAHTFMLSEHYSS